MIRVFLLMVLHCWLIEAQNPKYYHTRIECSGSLTCINAFCNLNFFDTYEATINTGCILLRPLLDFKVQQTTKEAYGYGPNQEYRPIFEYPPYNWCETMRDAAINPLYKLIVQAVSNSVPELFHPCPYWGIVAAYNMTLNMDKIFRFFKAGEYTNTMKVYDVLDSQIFKIKIYTTVT